MAVFSQRWAAAMIGNRLPDPGEGGVIRPITCLSCVVVKPSGGETEIRVLDDPPCAGAVIVVNYSGAGSLEVRDRFGTAICYCEPVPSAPTHILIGIDTPVGLRWTLAY